MSKGYKPVRTKGYKPVRTVFVLEFENPDLEGCEVRCTRLSLGALREVADLLDAAESMDEDKPDPEALKAVDRLFTTFAKSLTGWNVIGEDGQPVPATKAGLESLDFWFAMKLISAWLQGMMQAPPVLPATSSSGGTSEAAPEAMAALSASLPSSPGQRL